MELLIILGLIIIVTILVRVLSAHQEQVALRDRKLAAEKAENDRKEGIYKKYGQTEVAEKIISGTLWVGATSEQLLDSWGQPLDIDENVLKTKKKEIWKYRRMGVNRYGYKIKIENGIVVGWDEKV